MKSNLDEGNFRNGDLIPEAVTEEEWQKAAVDKRPAWCYYENSKSNGSVYGKLYNWWAVSDPRGLAPSGYHIPDIAEWSGITEFFGGRNHAGSKIKDGLLKAPIGGYRSGLGAFYGKNTNGYFWTNSVIFRDVVSNVVLSNSNAVVYFNYSRMKEGLSVRCIKD